jgi:hypothetical protein
MLKVFLCLQPKQEYVRSLVHQLLTLVYWRKKKNRLPFWKLFKEDVAKFNEEPIELSFSLLGRSLKNDGMRNNIDHVRNKYKGVKNYVMFKQEFQKEFLDKDTMKSVSGRFTIKEGNAKLAQVKAWLLDVINKCRYNAYLVYTGKDAYKSADAARINSINVRETHVQTPRAYLQDSVSVLGRLKERLRDSIENDWADANWGETWDAFKVPVVIANVHLQGQEPAEEQKFGRQVVGRVLIRKKAAENEMENGEVTEEEESDAGSVDAERIPPRKRRAAAVDFTNKLAMGNAAENGEFETLKTQWLLDHPGQKLAGAPYFALADLAKTNASLKVGTKRKRVGDIKGVYNESEGNELDLEKALLASKGMTEAQEESDE